MLGCQDEMIFVFLESSLNFLENLPKLCIWAGPWCVCSVSYVSCRSFDSRAGGQKKAGGFYLVYARIIVMHFHAFPAMINVCSV